MRQSSSIAVLLFCVILGAGVALAYGLFSSLGVGSVAVVVTAFVIAWIVAIAVKIAAPWDRAVVLRLGRFKTLRGRACLGSFRSSTPSRTGSTRA